MGRATGEGGAAKLVQATDVPGVVRVSFTIEAEEKRQAEIVCIVKAAPSPLRLQIFYSHHVWRRRVTPTSKWEDENIMTLPFTPELETQILFNVRNELWSALTPHTGPMPEGVGLAGLP